MYELFTLGGGAYLVDLLNAVAAITSGGAYITLAQLAGVAGLAWVLFRTAFGGSWKDNAKWILLFVTVWGAMIVPKTTVRVSESLATSHEQRAAEARSLSRHWSAEAGQARNAAVTDATGLIERYSHDVSTGEAFARGVTESESSQAQQFDSHVEKLSENRRDIEEPGGGADRAGQGGRGLGLHRHGRR